MSDPVSNSDIEDVLSSIRRLVSEEPTARKSPDPEEAARAERLVLTPAFRVEPIEDSKSAEVEVECVREAAFEEVEPEPALAPILLMPNGTVEELNTPQDAPSNADMALQAFEPSAEWHASEPDDAATEDRQDAAASAEEQSPTALHPAEMSLEDRIAELEAAIERAPQEWEPDGSEDGDDDETRPLSADLSPSEPVSSTDQLEDDPLQSASDDLAQILPLQETVEPEHETDVRDFGQEAPFQFQPEHPEQEVFGALESASEDLSDVGEAEEYTTIDPDLVENAEILPSAEDPTAVDGPERLVDTKHDTPDATPEPDQAALDMAAAAWEEEAGWAEPENGLDVDPVAQQEPQSRETEENILENDDMVTMDEAALRELVGELVRDELQGMLGERITRNVRRLVRHEIQRALSVRDLQK